MSIDIIYSPIAQAYPRKYFSYFSYINMGTESSLTADQANQYLEYIGLPPQNSRTLDLDFLSTLHTHHISAIPYENLVLHYSKDAKISLDVQSLFRKLTRNGRGGYCMEHSIFFNHVLRRLGFQAYMTGARIRYRVDGIPQGNFSGWYIYLQSVLRDILLCKEY
jgi:arylamine N-acetyltransferase